MQEEHKEIIIVDKSEIEQAIARLQGALSKQDIDITANISFEEKDNSLVLKATNNEIYQIITINPKSISSNFNALVNGRKIFQIIKALEDGDISLKIKDEHLVINQAGESKGGGIEQSSFNLMLYATNLNFNQSIDLMEELKINPKEFLNAFKIVSHACSSSSIGNISMHSIFVDIKKELINIVSTDSKRLAIYKITNSLDKTLSFIISKNSALEILKLFYGQENMKIYVKKINQEGKEIIESLGILEDNKQFYTKLINPNYVDYAKVVPSGDLKVVRVQKDSLIKALNKVQAIEASKVKLSFSENNLTLSSLDLMNTENSSVKIAINCNLEDFHVGVSITHLKEVIAHITKNIVEFSFQDINMPFLIKDDNFLEVIMPHQIERGNNG